jgi:hypothetical protein
MLGTSYVLHHGKYDSELGVFACRDDDPRAVTYDQRRTGTRPTASDQRAHERHTMPFSQGFTAALPMGVLALASAALCRVLSRWSCFSCERGFVDFKRDRGHQTNIRRDTVSDGESHQVTWEERVGERRQRGTISIVSCGIETHLMR